MRERSIVKENESSEREGKGSIVKRTMRGKKETVREEKGVREKRQREKEIVTTREKTKRERKGGEIKEWIE